MAIKRTYDGTYCPECDEKLPHDLHTVHHCLIYVNGLPTPGKEHMKTVFEIISNGSNAKFKEG